VKRSVAVALALTLLAAAGTASGQSFLNSSLQGLANLKPGETQRASSSDPNWENGNGDARPIPPGETLVIADLTGPGMITHIWNTIADSERNYSRLVVIRMYWDEEEHPSVEAPLGDFFGMGHGLDRSFATLPIRVTSEGRARNCYWPMPFAKSAKITVTNEGRQPVQAFFWYVDWQKLPEVGPDVAYFHAMYRQEFPTVSGRNYLLADIEGKGHYVGTVLNVRQLSPSWYGEGDDFFFIDGEDTPRLHGTGTEDYFCDAWGFREHVGLFYGAPLIEGYYTGGRSTVYRWHIPDPVCFSKSLRVEIEHKGVTFNEDGAVKSGFEERTDEYSSVAYWYQLEPHKPYPPMPPAFDRVYVDWTKIIEAESLIPKAEATSGPVAPQELKYAASGDSQLFWTPAVPEQALEISFELEEGGEYNVWMLITRSFDYGIYQFAIDDRPLGDPLDLFSKSVEIREQSFAPILLDAGEHVLRAKNVGKNVDSKGYYFGLDGLLFEKTE